LASSRSAARIWRTQKLSDCSKSTKVPAGQISLWISSRVTTSPGLPARSSSTLSGWGCRHGRAVAAQLAAAHVSSNGQSAARAAVLLEDLQRLDAR
jgi:hypothetical protein